MPLFTIFVPVNQTPAIVNQKNTIKSLIPQRMYEFVPNAIRDRWANRIVEKVKEHNPGLYSAIGTWSVVPEEERESLINEILYAAEEVHMEVPDE
ncbi:MAG: hypothetical protein IK031_06550 [Bacteroidales bacterium]|nr:hypothetical protein [Bacteroidales bacterium]